MVLNSNIYPFIVRSQLLFYLLQVPYFNCVVAIGIIAYILCPCHGKWVSTYLARQWPCQTIPKPLFTLEYFQWYLQEASCLQEANFQERGFSSDFKLVRSVRNGYSLAGPNLIKYISSVNYPTLVLSSFIGWNTQSVDNEHSKLLRCQILYSLRPWFWHWWFLWKLYNYELLTEK